MTKKQINNLYRKYQHTFDPVLFILITLIAHKLYWENIRQVEEWNFFEALRAFLKKEVYCQSSAFIILFTDHFYFDHSTIYLTPLKYVSINESCTGLKQFYQLGIILLLFPGPIKHKLWYIPSTIVIMHFTNVLRIVVLSVLLHTNFQIWQFSHDWILRPFFYVIIFIFWWIWNDVFNNKPKTTRSIIDKTKIKGLEDQKTCN